MTLRLFFIDTLSNFLGDVLAAAFIASVAYLVWRLTKYPGFRVGASWTYKGWNVPQMKRFPNASDTGVMEFVPNVVVNSYDLGVKKIIHSVWVRQRADPNNPGNILGHRDLRRDSVPVEERTTGGDLLTFQGPVIQSSTSKFHEVVNCPVFIQTSDGLFYKAESGGNNPTGVVRLRYRYKNALYKIKQQVFSVKSYVQKRLGK